MAAIDGDVITFQVTGPNIIRLNLMRSGREVKSVPILREQETRAVALLKHFGWEWSTWMDMRRKA